MTSVIPSEDELRAILDGTLTYISVNQTVRAGDLVAVREACNDVHPLAIEDGRYSQPGRAGIVGPPKVDFRTVYRIDGPMITLWKKQGWPFWTHDFSQRSCTVCINNVCKYPTVCSNKTCYDGTTDLWTPARFAKEWTARVFLDILRVADRTAEVRTVWRRDLLTLDERRRFDAIPDFSLSKRKVVDEFKAGAYSLFKNNGPHDAGHGATGR